MEVPAGPGDPVAHAFPVVGPAWNLEGGVPAGHASPGDRVLANHFAYEDLSFLVDDPSSSLVD